MDIPDNQYNKIKNWDDNEILSHISSLVSDILIGVKKTQPQYEDHGITYIDIGANVGKVYDEMSKHIPVNEARMIEAHPTLAKYCSDKYKDNKHVIVENFAAGNTTQDVKFNACDLDIQSITDATGRLFDPGWNLGVSSVWVGGNTTIQMKSISEWLTQNNHLYTDVSLIKIDTENQDLFILESLEEVIDKFEHDPIISFEVNWFYTPQDVVEVVFEKYKEKKYKAISWLQQPVVIDSPYDFISTDIRDGYLVSEETLQLL